MTVRPLTTPEGYLSRASYCTYQISLKSKKLFVDGWMNGRANGHFTFEIHFIRSTRRSRPKQVYQETNHVTCHVFAHTTHVVVTPHGFACVVTVVIPTTQVIYSKFHRNLFRGFRAPVCRNLPFPIALTIGF